MCWGNSTGGSNPLLSATVDQGPAVNWPQAPFFRATHICWCRFFQIGYNNGSEAGWRSRRKPRQVRKEAAVVVGVGCPASLKGRCEFISYLPFRLPCGVGTFGVSHEVWRFFFGFLREGFLRDAVRDDGRFREGRREKALRLWRGAKAMSRVNQTAQKMPLTAACRASRPRG